MFSFFQCYRQYRRIQHDLQAVAQALSSQTGEQFFQALAQHLTRILKVDYAFIGELSPVKDRAVGILALAEKGRLAQPFEYDLAGTPCNYVVGKQTCVYREGVRKRFPEDHLLEAMGIESYAGTPLLDSEGRPTGLIVILHTKPLRNTLLAETVLQLFAVRAGAELERRQARIQLAERAIRDPLTQLYNRRYFNQRISQELAEAGRRQEPLAVLLCDIDRLKMVNVQHGQEIGDQLIRKVADIIQGAIRGSDLAFRWGGDEFLILLPGTDREGSLLVVERIRKGLEKLTEATGIPLEISTGIGLYPEHASGADALVRLTEHALNIAKNETAKVHIGEEEYRLDEKTVSVVFQPLVDIRNNTVMGYEALSRDSQGKQTIQELFRKFSSIGQLHEFKRICFQKQLRAAGELGLGRLFINVDFKLLHQLAPPPRPDGMDIVLEISELEAIHDVPGYLDTIRPWKEAGYRFAIDDFGAGFISLPFLAQLVPDYIKLDRSTVLQAVSSAEFGRFLKDLVRAIRNYCREEIIAEGIETEKERGKMQQIGISILQGFLLGRPQPLAPGEVQNVARRRDPAS